MNGLRYHQKSLDFISRTGVGETALPCYQRDSSETQIGDLERRYHITVPESVKEWYSLPNALRLLHRNTSEVFRYPDHFTYEDRVLVFVDLGGGWETYGVRLGEADPEVMSEGANDSGAGPRKPWRRINGSFSEFVYNYVRRERFEDALKDHVAQFLAQVRAKRGQPPRLI